MRYNADMQKLPVNQVLPEIKTHLCRHNRLILQAPPGAGKTTLVPLALLDQDWLDNKQIIMLEPRRLATRNAAARMADLLGEKVGETVGYQIRQDKKFSHKTRILVVTEGILTRKLQADPGLEGIGLVIFDEFHERNLHGDLSLAFCLQSQELLSEQLKILLMSATLDTQALSQLLTTTEQQVPIVTSQGRSHPVELTFREENLPALDHWNLSHIVRLQVSDALVRHQGNILVFLPGVREIKQLETELHEHLTAYPHDTDTSPVIIAPLYGDLSKSQQDQAIAPPPSGQRKIVLATNIAETSLTIEGINIVIDTGLQRQSDFDPGAGMNRLHTTMIAQDSAEQRSGRAGRLSAGFSYRLWSQSHHRRLKRHQSAEILRSDLTPMMLELAQWGIQEVEELQWLDQPPSGNVAQAKELLLALQAIDASGKITPHGAKILSLGIHPRLGHMLLIASMLDTHSSGLNETACLLAALITEKDIIKSNRHSNEVRSADLTYRLSVLIQVKRKQALDTQWLDTRQCHRVLQSAKEFQQRLITAIGKPIRNNNSLNNEPVYEMAGVLLAHAYPDRIAKLRNNRDRRYLLSNGKGAYFSYQDALANEDYLAIASLNQHTDKQQAIQPKEARIFLAATISLQQLDEYFADLIKQHTAVSWNSKLQKVEYLQQKSLGRLILDERPITDIDREKIYPFLLQGVRTIGLDCLPWSKQSNNLRQRIQFIHYQQQYNPACVKPLAGIELPDFSDASLLVNLEQWLLPHLTDENSIKQLQALDLEQILNSGLSWEQKQIINDLAPQRITVPSGSEVRIDYSEPQAPFLAVRLQELFGLHQTPSILKGHVPLLLHLLSPAFRPMQLTQDLASFWKNTYNDVKKELRGKYKKHYWPDDPLQAQATNRAKPRKSRDSS